MTNVVKHFSYNKTFDPGDYVHLQLCYIHEQNRVNFKLLVCNRLTNFHQISHATSVEGILTVCSRCHGKKSTYKSSSPKPRKL